MSVRKELVRTVVHEAVMQQLPTNLPLEWQTAIADAVAASVACQLSGVGLSRDFLLRICSQSTHGDRFRQVSEDCAANCIKCEAERMLAASPQPVLTADERDDLLALHEQLLNLGDEQRVQRSALTKLLRYHGVLK